MTEPKNNSNLEGVSYIITLLKRVRIAYIVITLLVFVNGIESVVMNPTWWVTLWAVLITCGWGFLAHRSHKELQSWKAILVQKETKTPNNRENAA